LNSHVVRLNTNVAALNSNGFNRCTDHPCFSTVFLPLYVNFLAHLYLSGPPGEIMLGNFMADSVRSSMDHEFSAGIQQGIRLHRHIDRFTDNHPLVTQSKERLRVRYHKYAPVIVDVFYDHFLAHYWKEYYPDASLGPYAEVIYTFLGKHRSVFPDRSNQFFEYMVRTNALCLYAKTEGIQRVMTGMSHRARFSSGMETCTEELILHYPEFEQEFRLFFPELRASCDNLLLSF
jgi:acyl carrier protein phosphodiesterase